MQALPVGGTVALQVREEAQYLEGPGCFSRDASLSLVTPGRDLGLRIHTSEVAVRLASVLSA